MAADSEGRRQVSGSQGAKAKERSGRHQHLRSRGARPIKGRRIPSVFHANVESFNQRFISHVPDSVCAAFSARVHFAQEL
jgi:hypothetical protein